MATYLASRAALDGAISEKQWSQVVVEFAAINGWLVYRTWRSVHSPPGFPDLTMVRRERVVFAELKQETGRLSPSQKDWRDRLSVVPFVEWYLWRPSQWEEVRNCLLREVA